MLEPYMDSVTLNVLNLPADRTPIFFPTIHAAQPQ